MAEDFEKDRLSLKSQQGRGQSLHGQRPPHELSSTRRTRVPLNLGSTRAAREVARPALKYLDPGRHLLQTHGTLKLRSPIFTLPIYITDLLSVMLDFSLTGLRV